MYAYIDETGNTGKNLFDKNQPLFMTAAIITKEDFDLKYGQKLIHIANRIGESVIHANLIGGSGVEQIADDIIDLFETSDAKFFVSSVEKKYLVTAKLVDTLFDSAENKAVPWHTYNFRLLRLKMVFDISYILSEATAKKFLQSILETNTQKANILFSEALSEIKNNVPMLQDKRVRQLITDAIDWAQDNPEEIYFHAHSKAIRKGHLPNMVVFPNLLQGIEKVSIELSQPVKEIVHDRQNEFQEVLKEWHGFLSNASSDKISFLGEEPFSLQCVANSNFRISSSNESAGIQVIDLVLWIFGRHLQKKQIWPKTIKLLDYALKNGLQHSLSFESVGAYLNSEMNQLFSAPLREEDIVRAKEILALSEKRRQENVRRHLEK